MTNQDSPIAVPIFQIIQRDPYILENTFTPLLFLLTHVTNPTACDQHKPTKDYLARVDFWYNKEGEQAHLLPNAPKCCAAFFMLTKAASGIFADNYFKQS